MCSTRRSPSVAHSRRLECFARTKRSTGSQFGTSWPPTPSSRATTWKHLRFLSFDPIRGAGSELTKFDLDSTPTSLDWEISPDGTQLAIFLADLGRIYVRSLRDGSTREFQVKGWGAIGSLYWTGDSKGCFATAHARTSRLFCMWTCRAMLLPYGKREETPKCRRYPRQTANASQYYR